MKKFLLSFIFIFCSVVISAQETEKSTTEDLTKESISNADNTSIKTKVTTPIFNKENQTTSIDKVCYGEISKVAFYEALLSKNGFKVTLKNSNDLVIKSTEEIISRKRDEILYSEEEEE